MVAASLGLNKVLINGAQPIIESFGAGTLFVITLLFGIVANLVVTPLTILTALAAPMAELAMNFGFDPKACLFTLIFSEFLIVLPYETAPSLVWFWGLFDSAFL